MAAIAFGLLPGLAVAAGRAKPVRATCPDAARIVKGPDGWSAIAPPAFEAGGPKLVSYAVDPRDPSRIFVTNGTEVVRSSDGGCTFEEVFTLGASPDTSGRDASNSAITQVVIPDSPAASQVAAVVAPRNGVAPGPGLLLSSNGDSWSTAGEGLPPIGTPTELEMSASDPAIAYMVVSHGATLSDVYVTEDGGATFSSAAGPGADVSPAQRRVGLITELAIDPASPRSLWGATPDGLLHSTDGGSTWERDARVAFRFSTVLVTRSRATATVLAFRQDPEFLVYLSTDGGGTWRTLPGPRLPEPAPFGGDDPVDQVPVVSAAAGRGGEVVAAMGAPSAVHRLASAAAGSWEGIAVGRPPLRDLSFDRIGNGRLYALGDYGLYRYDGLSVPSVERPPPFKLPDRVYCLVDDRDLEGVHHEGAPPSLTPRDEVVTLEEGRSAEVPYELDLRTAPVLLDVFFLLDTSMSMDDIMCGLARSLAGVVANVSVQVPDIALGLGEYNDHYPYPNTDGERYPECLHTYKRRVAIGPPSDEIAKTLQKMPTCGGREPALIALEEVVLGDGQDLLPAGDSAGDIPAGRGAGWRDGPGAHQRVIVHATDERVQYFEDGPSMKDVTELLRAEDVRHVGISGSEFATDDLQTLSAGAETIATGDGVDCDGDGKSDVSPGAPLVCPMFHDSGAIDNLDRALVDIFRSLSLHGDVDFAALDGGAGIVDGVAPGGFTGVDFRVDHLLPFSVRYRCPQVDEDRTFDVRVEASSAGRAIDGVVTRVRCLDNPEPPLPGTPQRAVAVAALVAAGAPPPPPVASAGQPQPHPEPAAQTNPQSQAQSQGQAQAQAAMVPQKQAQPQVALVRAAESLRERQAMEYAMTRVSGHRPTWDGGGTMAAGALAGLALVWLSLGTVVATRRVRR